MSSDRMAGLRNCSALFLSFVVAATMATPVHRLAAAQQQGGTEPAKGGFEGIAFKTGKTSDVFFRPDTAHVNLQVLPAIKETTPASQKIHGFENSIADRNAEYVGDIVIKGTADGGLPKAVVCHTHKTYQECLLDVECGWCEGRSGQFCVEGSFAGPCNASLDCPLYVTYQQEGMGAHDCGTGHDPCNDKVEDMFATTFKMPMTGFNTVEEAKEEALLKEKNFDPSSLTAKPLSNQATVKIDKNGEPEVGNRREDLAKKEVYDGPSLDDHLTKMLVDPQAVDNISEEDTPSPCGLPGTSQDLCNSWVATHCLGDKAETDSSCQLALSLGVQPPELPAPPNLEWPPQP